MKKKITISREETSEDSRMLHPKNNKNMKAKFTHKGDKKKYSKIKMGQHKPSENQHAKLSTVKQKAINKKFDISANSHKIKVFTKGKKRKHEDGKSEKSKIFTKGKKREHENVKSEISKVFIKGKKREHEDGKSKKIKVFTKANKRKHEDGNSEDQPSDKKVKLFSLKKKDRKHARKQNEHKDAFERSTRLKKLWEEMRCDKCTEERKQELLKECIKLVKGHVKEVIMAHDTVRVIECMFRLGNESHRAVLFEELQDIILSLCKSKYGKFFVIQVFRNGTKSQKEHVLKQFYGNVTKLTRHTEAAAVVEVAFNEFATAAQRAELLQEFYGPTYKYFKESGCHALKEILEKNPGNQADIIKNMKEAIMKFVQKSVVRYSIVHCVLRSFMTYADPGSRAEVIEAIRQSVVDILHTKDGSRVAMQCLWHGTAKDRKAIVKSFKTHIPKIAKEEYGHLVLLAMFDCVDDTKLIEKHILSELISDIAEISSNLHGRKVLLYLASPRDSLHFPPDLCRILEEGDSNKTSKKDALVRRSELQQSISPYLLQFIVDTIQSSYTENAMCLFVLTVIKHAKGSITEAVKSIGKCACVEYNSETKNRHFIESVGSHILLKKLIDEDKAKASDVSISELLIESASSGILRSWTACNRGCFILVHLLETEIPSVIEKVKAAMEGYHNKLSKKQYKGAQILLNKLKL